MKDDAVPCKIPFLSLTFLLIWNPSKATLAQRPHFSLQGSRSYGPRDHVTILRTQRWCCLAQQGGTKLGRRDLGFFHVVSQSGQTNPAERSHKLGTVNFSCWEALTVYKGGKIDKPLGIIFFAFISLWGQLWKGNDCKQPIRKTALVKMSQRKVISHCYVSQGLQPRFKRPKTWTEAPRCARFAKNKTK